MARITKQQIHEAYNYAKAVYEGSVTRNEAVQSLNKSFGLSVGSAGDFIQNFKKMLSSVVYTRTLNEYATRYFLDRIREDFGEDAFFMALSSVRAHVDYYDSLGHGRLAEPPPINESISGVNPDKLWATYGRYINGTEALYGGADYRISATG